MKINYKNYPILKKLEDGLLGKVAIPQEDAPSFIYDKSFQRIPDAFKSEHKHFSKIYYITEPFFQAMQKAENSLISLLRDIHEDNSLDFDVKGSFIVGNDIFLLKHIIKKDSDYNNTTFYHFKKDGTFVCFYESGNDIRKGMFGWVASPFKKEINMCGGAEAFIMKHIGVCLLIEMFRTYAIVETKNVEPKSSIVYDSKKCENFTKLNITHLDSKWFTNIVRSDGFEVRGHFRLQPKKINGEWTKELIWINNFQKNGYTSKAKILTHQDEDKVS